MQRLNLYAIFLVIFLSSVLAQYSYAQGPGFPNVNQTKGELLSGPLAPTQGRTAVIVYHQGFLITNPESPGSAPGSDLLTREWNISDPRSPVSRVITGVGPNSGIAAHGYWQEQEYLRSLPSNLGGELTVRDFDNNGSYEVGRVTTPGNLQFYYPINPPVNLGWLSRGLMFQPFQTQMWWSYGATNLSGALYKRNQLLSIWDHIGQTGVIGHPFLVGNTLYLASDQSNTGIAAYDITPSLNSPGTQPRLISVLNAPVGGYWPEMWGGGGRLLIMFPARENGRFYVADVTDPANMQVIADRQLASGGDPAYIQFQDNYAFMDRYKINMTDNFSVDLTLNAQGNGIDVSQFALPIGNLLATGGYPIPGLSQGLAIWAHQAEPDTRGPEVGYHIPRVDQTNYPVGAPITLLIHETLRSETIINCTNFIVREVGNGGTYGPCLTGRLAFAFDDILTFTSDSDLNINSTYEVTLVANGIRDAANNGMIPYSFRFSTGSQVNPGNQPPSVNFLNASNYPAITNTQITLSYSANDPENDQISYQLDFGDGSPVSSWSTSMQQIHTYSAQGHYDVILKVRDTYGATTTRRLRITVADSANANQPKHNSTIAYDQIRNQLWVVNSDNNSISRIHDNNQLHEIFLGNDSLPRNVALDSTGNAWITSERADQIVIISSEGQELQRINLSYGSSPFGIVFSLDFANVYVTLYGTGELRRFSASTKTQTGNLLLGPTARAIAITADGQRALVTRFISTDSSGSVWDISLAGSMSLSRTINLQKNEQLTETPSGGRGLPNYLAAVAIRPNSNRAWIVSKQDNIDRGLFRRGLDLNQENSIRAIVSEINLDTNTEVFAARRDIDNSDSPSALTFSPLGDYAFITLQGNNVLSIYDAFVSAENEQGMVPQVARLALGLAPQGVVFSASQNRIYAQNFLSRSVSVLSGQDFMQGQSLNMPTTNISTINNESLAADVLHGKTIFYNASDNQGPFGRNRMSGEGYISCASCHVDGGHDGRTWDFTGRGEGLRNTTDLRGRRGMGHGNVHWSANFDEIQDFENDIRNNFGGAGFMSDNDFIQTSDTLGAAKQGRSYDLDALAAYVTSLGSDKIPKSPYRNSDGGRTSAGARGEQIFNTNNCRSCHSGQSKTDSAINSANLHNVGTLSTSSGFRLGFSLDGIDTPTLLGLHATAPYLHDGQAANLESLINYAGKTIYQAESETLLNNATAFTATWGGSYSNGQSVGFSSAADGILWQNVDGGLGGEARLTFRYSALYSLQRGVLTVNGVNYNLNFPSTPNNPNWFANAFSELSIVVNLQAGTNNSIQFNPVTSYGQTPIIIDYMTVENSTHRSIAYPHRQILALESPAVADLLEYLRSLDGSDDTSNPPTPTPLATPTNTPASTPVSNPTTTPTATPTARSSSTAVPTAIPTSTPFSPRKPMAPRVRVNQYKVNVRMQLGAKLYEVARQRLGKNGSIAGQVIYSSVKSSTGKFKYKKKGLWMIKYRMQLETIDNPNSWSAWSDDVRYRVK